MLQDGCNLKDDNIGTINKLEAVLTETGYLSKIKPSTVFAIALITLTAVGMIFGLILVTFKDSDTDKDYSSLGFGNIIRSKFFFIFTYPDLFRIHLTF